MPRKLFPKKLFSKFPKLVPKIIPKVYSKAAPQNSSLLLKIISRNSLSIHIRKLFFSKQVFLKIVPENCPKLLPKLFPKAAPQNYSPKLLSKIITPKLRFFISISRMVPSTKRPPKFSPQSCF